MLTHDTMYFMANKYLKSWDTEGLKDGHERVVSYLPLSHSAGQVYDLSFNLVGRAQMYFARPDALQGSLVGKYTSVFSSFPNRSIFHKTKNSD